MSTTPQPLASQPGGHSTSAGQDHVTVISHSPLFYWWPVWAIGFIMSLYTYFDGYRMAVVPPGTQAKALVKGESPAALVYPEGKDVEHVNKNDPSSETVDPRVHITRNKNVGVIFCTVLLLVIVITNVPLRGMWSVVVIILLILFSVIFALAGWWEWIFSKLYLLDIRINMGGYLFISTILFIAWFVTIVFFDKNVYIEFTAGQFKVCTEIGGGEKVYDTIGLTLERQRADLFRHYILGLGSGDLIVKTTGAQAHHFDLPNVLFINRKVKLIEDLLRRQKIVETK